MSVIAGPPGSGISHVIHAAGARLHLSGAETATAEWLGFARLVGRPISSDESFDLRAELEALLGTSTPSALHPFDIAVDDAHLLTPQQLDVMADVATRYRCVFGIHPGEAAADDLLRRFGHARVVVPEIVAAQELRTLLTSLSVPADRHDEFRQKSSGLPGVARALAIGGVAQSAMFARYDALVTRLEPDELEWIVRSELAPSDQDRLLLPPPPPQLVARCLVREGARRCEFSLVTDRVMELSVATHRDSRLALAALLTDPISQARLLRDCDLGAEAAALAFEHAAHEANPDRRATLLAIAATTSEGQLVAAEALLRRERADEALAVIGKPGEHSTTSEPTIGDTGALVQLRARAARQLDLEDRWSYFDELSHYPPTDEWRRQSDWCEGLPLRPPPAHLVLPAPNNVDDLDGARLIWHRALVGIIDSDAAERTNRAGRWASSVPERLDCNASWAAMFDQVDALRQMATVGPSSDITDMCAVSAKPALPRALLEACQVLAWADSGNSNQSLAFTPTHHPTAPVERSLWAWVRSEAEYAAGHPLAAMRAAQDAADLQSAPAVLARACAAWAALDIGEQVAQPPVPNESAGWMIRAAVQETRAVASLAEITAAGGLDAGAAAAIAAEFTSLADIWEGWLVRAELRCRWAAADAARVAGAPDAVELLRVAEHRAEQAGLSPLLQRVRRSLRLAGVRRVGRRTSNSGILSARELEVIGLVGKGLSTRTIATQLGISPATVETQVASVMAKLGVRSRLQAALQAQRLQQ